MNQLLEECWDAKKNAGDLYKMLEKTKEMLSQMIDHYNKLDLSMRQPNGPMQ